MKAFKTYEDCPESNRPSGIPLDCPWQVQDCSEDMVEILESNGFTVVSDVDYETYLLGIKPDMDAWEAQIAQAKNDAQLKVYDYISMSGDKTIPPVDVDFITGLSIKLHRKVIIVKGECQKEEFYVNYDGTTYSDLVVDEVITFTRDVLGFPNYKTTTLRWYKKSGEVHETQKTWVKYYSNLEKIQEGKVRRGNLVAGLQMPCIGLISIALIGTPNATPVVILEGRRFLANYAPEFTLFIEDSNKTMLDCLGNVDNPRYISSSDYTWIDSMTPYGITIRQFILNEMSI